MSLKALDPSAQPENTTDTNYHCMAFMFNQTSKLEDGSVTYVHINYTCDVDNNCLGREEPFEVSPNTSNKAYMLISDE